jgi:hypothetical protein
MSDSQTTRAGLVIPSDSPVLLAFVGLHVLVVLACVVLGFVTMMSSKRPGRHPRFGTAYYACAYPPLLRRRSCCRPCGRPRTTRCSSLERRPSRPHGSVVRLGEIVGAVG